MAEPSSSSSAGSASSVTISFSTSTVSLPLSGTAGWACRRRGPSGIHQPMLGLVGIEMRTCRFEIRRLAFADRVHMEGMIAGRDASR